MLDFLKATNVVKSTFRGFSYEYFLYRCVNVVSSDLCGFTTLRKELLPNDNLGGVDTLFSLDFSDRTSKGNIMYIILPLVDVLAFMAFYLSCLLLQGGVRILLILLIKALCLLLLFGCRGLFKSVLRESIGYLYVWTCNFVFSRCTINERNIMYIILP